MTCKVFINPTKNVSRPEYLRLCSPVMVCEFRFGARAALCLFVTTVNLAKTDEPIEMPFKKTHSTQSNEVYAYIRRGIRIPLGIFTLPPIEGGVMR